jgi:hypothetical protein
VFQESEEEVTNTEQAENWFTLTSTQRICGEYLTLVEVSGLIYFHPYLFVMRLHGSISL